MSVVTALAAFCLAAALLTVTPGLDTVLVLRSRLAGGPIAGLSAAVGVALGCLIWGVAVSVGLGAVLAAAPRAYAALRLSGAAYLFCCGLLLVVRPRHSLGTGPAEARSASPATHLARGLLTNLLNPKVGLFYLSFLPQFVPQGYAAGPFMLLLAGLHAAMGLAWLATLCMAVGIVRRRVLGDAVLLWLDRLTGMVFISFGLKLALDRT